MLTARGPDLLARAERAHTEHGLDFPAIFDGIFSSGIVIKTPDYLLLAYGDDANDAWIVWWADSLVRRSGPEMLREFLRHAPHWRPRIGWARGLRPQAAFRFYSTERLLRFTAQ